MFDGLLDHEIERPFQQLAPNHFERTNIDKSLEFPVSA